MTRTRSDSAHAAEERPGKRMKINQCVGTVERGSERQVETSSNDIEDVVSKFDRSNSPSSARSDLAPSPSTQRVLKTIVTDFSPEESNPFSPSNRLEEKTPSIKSKSSKDPSSSSHLYIYQRQEYDEGMFVYDQPLPVNAHAQPTLRSAMTLYNNAVAFVGCGKYQEARLWFDLALTQLALEAQDSQVPMVTYIIHHNLGHCWYRLGRNDDALKSYSKALAIAQERNIDYVHVAACLNCIAVILFHNEGNTPENVLVLFKHVEKVFRTSIGYKSRQVATVLNNMGRVYYLNSKYDLAMEAYTEALKTREELLGTSSIDVAATICNKGQTHHQRGELDCAMECYKKFRQIALAQLGSNHRDIAIIYKCMAEIHREQGDNDKARFMYESALQSGRAALGPFHPDVASTLNKLANLYYEMHDLDTALRYYMEGLKIERVALEEGHPHAIVTILNVAQIHRQRGSYKKALENYKEACTLQLKKLGPNDFSMASILSNIGLMHYQLKDYPVAFDNYQEALRIQRDHFGTDDNLEIASTLNSIGLVLFNQGTHELALGCFNDSLRIRTKILGADHRDVAILWYNIATIHLERGNGDLAIELYQETLRVERIALGQKHHDVILTLQHLGLVYQQRGELDQALVYFSEALEIESTKTENHAAVGKLYNLIGNIHLQQADTAKMMECYSKASRVYCHAGKQAENLVIAGYNFYGLSKLHPPCAPIA
mmetsp:Transcript_16955/g.46500  ORF Transcript_16955/g.46500 Transcript_16955/m.46500 type:complete len:717 (+) Transcript_16955:158-2308(+)|eukprot:CAMPEP_0168729714 /NCGR_PEP_ID=MMETSP0724-20121128/6355_1 /TAXON_ID=265536 /ORGANISM="Amphiprora sp., Strain CCMP467" /LENGTH=716 /DNA_ID=CAMNT_0008776625 /DNA_START=128 /DNA_END=2278 /DNA_ORIENTATION=+